MALEPRNGDESGDEVGSDPGWRRNSSSNWLVFLIISDASVDFPEAGMPAMPIKRRS